MTFRQFEIDNAMKEHYRSARWTIAWLCLLLPFLSILFGFIGVLQGYNPAGWYYSISDTYYANSKAIMIGILSITTFYFATYKGYDIRDRIVNVLSAICASRALAASADLIASSIFLIASAISSPDLIASASPAAILDLSAASSAFLAD